MRTSATLPADHGRRTSPHYRLAAAMRNTDEWVHIGDYGSRKTASSIASNVRNGHWPAYRDRRYEAEAITNEHGVHQVWGRYAGERSTRR